MTRPVPRPAMVPGDSDLSLLPFLGSEPFLMAELSEYEWGHEPCSACMGSQEVLKQSDLALRPPKQQMDLGLLQLCLEACLGIASASGILAYAWHRISSRLHLPEMTLLWASQFQCLQDLQLRLATCILRLRVAVVTCTLAIGNKDHQHGLCNILAADLVH